MSKLAKIIISILSCIIVILLIVIVLLLNKNNSCNKQEESEEEKTNISKEDIKKVSGIYHTNNWNNKEATLELNNDMTCKYPTGRYSCKWTLSDNEIIITLTDYDLYDDIKVNQHYLSIISEEECNEYIEKYNLTSPHCEKKESEHIAKVVNSGVVLHDRLFNKLN